MLPEISMEPMRFANLKIEAYKIFDADDSNLRAGPGAQPELQWNYKSVDSEVQ